MGSLREVVVLLTGTQLLLTGSRFETKNWLQGACGNLLLDNCCCRCCFAVAAYKKCLWELIQEAYGKELKTQAHESLRAAYRNQAQAYKDESICPLPNNVSYVI